MNDREYNAQKKRVTALVKFWKPILGLSTWYIETTFYRDQAELARDTDFACGPQTVMACSVMWEYKEGNIRVNTIQTAVHDDEDLEAVVVHELMHFQVAEMRDWTADTPKHEERVVTELAEAIVRAYNQGRKDERKKVRPAAKAKVA